MKIDIPQEVKQIIDIINNHSYEAYLIGGAVRDAVLGKENDDYDLCTNMPLEELKKIIPNFTIMKENNHRNTGVIRINGVEIEVSSFKGKTIEEDLSKRDITINAIACNKEGNIIDPFNGIDDIKEKRIRLVNLNGSGIDYDPLRILRVLRFASSLGFTIDDNTKNIIKEKRYLLEGVAEERIYREFQKILVSDNVSSTIRDNKEIFCLLIPELEPTISFDQHNDYHIYDIFEHLLKVVENTPNNLYVRMAALFHDIGKPDCFTMDEKGVGHFLGHPVKSKEIFNRFANKYKMDDKTKDIVGKLVLYHERQFSTNPVKINKFFKEFGTDNLDLLFALKKADIKGQNPKYLDRLIEMDAFEKLYQEHLKKEPCISIKNLKINGFKLQEMGFYNRKIGIILKDVLDQVIEERLENDPEEIEDYINNHYSCK